MSKVHGVFNNRYLPSTSHVQARAVALVYKILRISWTNQNNTKENFLWLVLEYLLNDLWPFRNHCQPKDHWHFYMTYSFLMTLGQHLGELFRVIMILLILFSFKQVSQHHKNYFLKNANKMSNFLFYFCGDQIIGKFSQILNNSYPFVGKYLQIQVL